MSPLTPRDVLGPGGLLAKALPGYEPRQEQVAMAEAVAAALSERTPLLIEAPTGTGKTLAYLVPALLSGLRVVVSTFTRTLQDQLCDRELPLLERCLPVPFTAVRLKGISNYLCLRRLAAEEAVAEQRSLPIVSGLDRLAALSAFTAFRERTLSGDRAELTQLADDDPLWLSVSATSETRLGSRCPHFEPCFVTKARRAAHKAELVVVNHHLLCADLSVRARFPEARLLPPYDALICDEAHELEEAATEHLGISFSPGRLRSLLQDATACGGAIAACAPPCAEQAQRLAAALPVLAAERRPLGGEDLDSGAAQAALDLDSALLDLADRCADAGGEIALQLQRRAHALRDDLSLIMEGARRPGARHVFFLERRGGQVALRAAPIDVAEALRRGLYAECPAVVMTSATLAPGGDFSYVRGRLGLADVAATEVRLPSPFDYGTQALLYLPDDLPEPADPAFLQAATARMAELVALTDGRALLLFTSHRRMVQAWERLRPQLGRYLLLLQGEAPRHHLIERFRDPAGYPSAVLFGTASFWQGVDVVGDALQLVVIDKLPFAPPDDPLIAGRMARREAEGEDPFNDYQVPQAALLLAQGCGRLIRHREDRGILALLDRRAASRPYGAAVLGGLPAGLRRVARWQEVVAFWQKCIPPAAPDLR